jgi:peptide deformylase
MALLPIYPYDAKVLREETHDIAAPDTNLATLVVNMFDTMHAANGIGLAANQVGVGSSLFVVDLSVMDGHENESPLVFINPVILDESDEEVTYEEGCLSVPDVREEIWRPERIRIRYRDLDFNEHEIEAGDMLARVIQHEYDHLLGVFFTDYLKGLKKRLLVPVLKKIKNGEAEADYRMATKVPIIG